MAVLLSIALPERPTLRCLEVRRKDGRLGNAPVGE